MTGWASGVAAQAAHTCFCAWLGERGTLGAREDAQAVAQLRAFILANGSARFDRWDDPPTNEATQAEPDSLPPAERFRTMKRAGWRRWESTEGARPGWRYYLTSDGLNEALAGLAPKEARRTLVMQGYLIPPKNAADADRGNTAALFTVPGHGKVRLYKVAPAILASTEGAD